jgi:uncharacterized protein YcaQ
VRTISMTALRRLVIGAQGYATRSRRGSDWEVEETIRALSCVQLDSITAVERSHRIVLGSRVGAYPRQTVSRLLGDGRVFEFWAHLACLIPVEDWPLYRAWMTPEHVLDTWRRDALGRYPELAEEVRAAIRERGLLTSRDFEGRGGGGGGMWDWKPAKKVLEALWNLGEVVIAGRISGFQRLYDLPERVLPREVLDAPVPDQVTRLRELIRRAVLARGALTDSGVANHWWHLRGQAARIKPVADELVAAGVLERLVVEEGGASVLVPAGADLDPPRPLGCRACLPIRQPAVGPPVRASRLRLRPCHRDLQARARAPVWVLRPSLPLARPDRRPRGPEVGPLRRSAAGERVSPRAGSSPLGGP